MIFNLSEQNSIANQFLLELRDSRLQVDRMRFRKNVERLGEIMAYEVSKKLDYRTQGVSTPLGVCTTSVLVNQPVLLTIMRAGLPYFQGFLNFFDRAEAGFIGAYRDEHKTEVTITLDYLATPAIHGKEIILIDPMLATGRSIMEALQLIVAKGTPAHVHIVSLIAAPEGLKHIQDNLTLTYSLWTCAVDKQLNDQFYIVPGLGDAGDLSYGAKS